jgi:hypothetical protein
MRLIRLAVALTVSLVLAPLAIGAQPAGKVYRVGTLGIKASDRGLVKKCVNEIRRRPSHRAGSLHVLR